MKSIFVVAALSALSAPAFAGPYANVENNAQWIGIDEFQVGLTEIHAGYELQAGEDVAVYVQAGPAFIHIEDEDTETEVSGKIGIVADVSTNVELYGEVAFITEDQAFELDTLALGTKVGATYRF
tara:strand:+ start:401 stop:775 length:375 start_codon:yes stop_codon:yes gene_type:complete